jgi:hypothetical protein
MTERQAVGIVDFGCVERCDPHLQFTFVPWFPGFGYGACLRLIEMVNHKSKSGPWIDVSRVVCLAAANMASLAIYIKEHPLERDEAMAIFSSRLEELWRLHSAVNIRDF